MRDTHKDDAARLQIHLHVQSSFHVWFLKITGIINGDQRLLKALLLYIYRLAPITEQTRMRSLKIYVKSGRAMRVHDVGNSTTCVMTFLQNARV